MRLFTAILPDEPMKDSLCKMMQKLSPEVPQGRFTSRGNLHVTLVFIGEVQPEALPKIKSALDVLPAQPPFDLYAGGIGCFAKSGILYAKVQVSPELKSIFHGLSGALEQQGVPTEKREYRPHITLARNAKLPPGFQAEEKLSMQMHMTVPKISLMLSERVNGTLTYTEIYSRTLEG